MSNIEELKGLAELKEQGILTEEEFQKEKEKILSRGSKTEEASPKSTPKPEPESTPEPEPDSAKDKLDKVFGKLIGYKRHKSWAHLPPEVKEAALKNPKIKKQFEEIEKRAERIKKAAKNALRYDW